MRSSPASFGELAALCNADSRRPQGPQSFDWHLRRDLAPYPFLEDPDSNESARAGTAHASGWRNLAGYPLFRGQPVASRQPEGRDAWKRATRLSSGDRVIALETWFYPTVWPNPMLDTKYLGYEMNGFVENPLDQPGCNGTSVPPYMGPFVMMGERSWMAVNALTAPWQGKRPPPSMAFDRTLAQGMLNDFGYGLDVPGQGLAPFTFHPHQVISLLVVNTGATRSSAAKT
ncbi:hypothetical protein FNF27_04779 [Cafeteria roenbergensis]|uniref:Uncharacterized protein n=1 Tax=Cafeteria roenbergensis TaxID=33653 RepID=A0A5A8E7X5_CAFRO|nr:hypothetical protein FNF27_04779 [Cafeteria roenbergensis]